jgi:glycosyltransferase involved in cell wall biosynthesis
MSDTIKVLMVESGGWGGIGHYTHNLCESLMAEKIEVHLLTASPYELDTLPTRFTLDAALRADQSYFRQARTLLERIVSTQADVVHIQSTFSARRDWLLWSILRLSGIRVVYTAHNVLPHDAAERNATGMREAYDTLYALAERIIVHGVRIREELVDRFAPDPHKVRVIPHGDYAFASPDDNQTQAEARKELGLPEGRPVILAFGALRAYKGLTELIDALPDIVDRVPGAVCVIAGKPVGVDPESYRAQATSRGVADRLILHDRYVPFEEISTYFVAADVAAFPYRNIAQSGALQLAYACSKPVVVTAVGALPETVDHGKNGLVIPPFDHDALVTAIETILTMDPEDRERMGQRSRELADEEHSWADAARSTVGLYQELLQT